MPALCRQDFEPVSTDFGGGVTRTAAWRETVKAMGEIPVLEEGRVTLTQTAPILLWLAERYGRFQRTYDAARYEMLLWLSWDNQKLNRFTAA